MPEVAHLFNILNRKTTNQYSYITQKYTWLKVKENLTDNLNNEGIWSPGMKYKGIQDCYGT